MSTKRSRVHPKYKTKYRVTNWSDYDRGLIRRGDLTLWISPEAIDTWRPTPSGTRGGQRQYSDTVILTALTLRLVFHLPLRHVKHEGVSFSTTGMQLRARGTGEPRVGREGAGRGEVVKW